VLLERILVGSFYFLRWGRLLGDISATRHRALRTRVAHSAHRERRCPASRARDDDFALRCGLVYATILIDVGDLVIT
jgi:hypothetical protein